MISFRRFVSVCFLCLLLADAVLCQKRLDPPPVPPLPPPPTEPPPVTLSSIRLPVSSNVPDLSIMENAACDFYKGHITQVEIIPPLQADADYEIWRDRPLTISLSGNTLTASMHGYYWLIGQLWILGIPIFGQCGAQGPGPLYGDEETREVIVTVDSSISWHRDWHLQTQTSVRPFNNINRCIVTTANKDITDYFNRAGENFLRGAAAKFDQRATELSNFRSKAEEMWAKLQEPIPIGSRAWLLVQPASAGAGTVNVTSTTPQTAETVFGLTARPRVIVGDQPSAGRTPLPPLEALTPGPPGFHLSTDVEISFEEANRIIQDPSTGVIGATFKSGRRELKIVGARIYGTGPKMAVELQVEGRAILGSEPKVVDIVTALAKAFNRVRYFFEKRLYKLKGKIYLTGTPQYQADRREIIFPDLEYDLQTKNVIAKIANWILKTRLTERLRAAVKLPLGNGLDTLQTNLSAGLNRPLGPRAILSGTIDSLAVERVYVGDGALRGRVVINGNAALAVSWK